MGKKLKKRAVINRPPQRGRESSPLEKGSDEVSGKKSRKSATTQKGGEPPLKEYHSSRKQWPFAKKPYTLKIEQKRN